MTTKKIKTSDILGDNYYIYELTSSNYTPNLNDTITITCTMKDVYGAAASGKSITLYQNGTSKEAQTTNSSGVATWSITCSTAGLQKFSIKDTSIEVFVDNKSDVGHTHSQYLTEHQSLANYVTTSDSRLSDARTPTSHTHGNLQNNGQVGSTAQANKNVVTNSSGLITTEDKPTIPSKTSQLTNDSGFLTSHQSLDSKTVTVEKLATATSGYLSSYVVKQNGVQVGNTIDIPKDFLVKSGSVKTVITDNNPVSGYSAGDRYIDFVINTKDNSGTDEHMYILVSDLVQDNSIEYINGTHSDTSTFIFTGNSYVFNSVSDIKDGSMIIYRVPVTSTNDSNNLKLQIICKGASGYGAGSSTAYIMKNNAHVTASQYPINTKLLLMYQNGWNIIGQTNLDDAYATANHTHNATEIQDSSAHNRIGSGANDNQANINDSIDYALAELDGNILSTKMDLVGFQKFQVKDFINPNNWENNGCTYSDGVLTFSGSNSFTATFPTDSLVGELADFELSFDYIIDDGLVLNDTIDFEVFGRTGHHIVTQGDIDNGYVIIDVSFKSENNEGIITSEASGDEWHINYVSQGNPYTINAITPVGDYTKIANIRYKANNIISLNDNKEDVYNKVTSLSSSSTDTQYPSAKAVYDSLDVKEDKSNKVTSISSSSTDTQYPSAKVVYDSLNEKANKSQVVDWDNIVFVDKTDDATGSIILNFLN